MRVSPEWKKRVVYVKDNDFRKGKTVSEDC